MRHQCFITNLKRDAATLELHHRGHARVEDRTVTPRRRAALCLDRELAIAEPSVLAMRSCTRQDASCTAVGEPRSVSSATGAGSTKW